MEGQRPCQRLKHGQSGEGAMLKKRLVEFHLDAQIMFAKAFAQRSGQSVGYTPVRRVEANPEFGKNAAEFPAPCPGQAFFCRSGGIVQKAEIHVPALSVQNGGETVRCEMQDTGMGLQQFRGASADRGAIRGVPCRKYGVFFRRREGTRDGGPDGRVGGGTVAVTEQAGDGSGEERSVQEIGRAHV